MNYLDPGSFIDSDHPAVIEFASNYRITGEAPIGAAIRLYLAVRDEITYDPYEVGADRRFFRASHCLLAGHGFCIPKAALLAACARVTGIPARVGYADVRNHLSTKKLDDLVGGNVYAWHGYTDLFLQGKWTKATPAFNKSLCERFGVKVLEFDGQNDSLFQEFNRTGQRHMEYVRQRGTFDDVPFVQIVADFERLHPRWLHHKKDQSDEMFEHQGRPAAR